VVYVLRKVNIITESYLVNIIHLVNGTYLKHAYHLINEQAPPNRFGTSVYSVNSYTYAQKHIKQQNYKRGQYGTHCYKIENPRQIN
jgi:hypothetical protein